MTPGHRQEPPGASSGAAARWKPQPTTVALAAGLVLAGAAFALGPHVVTPQAVPEPGEAGELWMRVRLCQVLALAASAWLILAGAPGLLPAAGAPQGHGGRVGGWTGGRSGGRTGERTDGRTGRWTVGRTGGQTAALEGGGLALAGALLILIGFWFRYGIYDDAYISLRYARNLVRGAGLVYNPGERVEGYTSLLWVLILSGLRVLTRAGFVQLAVVSSAVCGLAVIFLCSRLTASEGFRGGRPIQVLPLALCLPLVIWSFSGMETALFASFLLLGLILLSEGAARETLAAGLVFGLACLIRPEALLVGPVAGLAASLQAPPGARARAAACFAGPFLAVAAPQFLFRLGYYKELLPNTYYTKVDGSSWSLMAYGLKYLCRGLVWEGPLLLLALLGWLRPPEGVRDRRRRTLAWCLVLGQAASIVYTGADHFAEMRFFVPMVPLLLVLAIPGARWVAERIARGGPGGGRRVAEQLANSGPGADQAEDPPGRGPMSDPRGWMASGALLAAALISLVVSFFYGGVGYDSSLRYGPVIARHWAVIGEWLGREAKPTDLLATPVAGAIPYVSDLRTLDMQGLTDRTIAHKKAGLGGRYKDHEKWDLDYVLGRNPDWVFFGHFGVESIQDLQSRPLLPVLEALAARLPIPGYELISGQYRGQAFTFLHRR